MFNTIKAWLSKPSKAAKRPNRMILQLHPLEDRFMPAVTRQALLDTFNTGVAVVRDAAAVTKVVQTVAADVPLVAENLSQVTKLADSLQAALAAVTDPGAAVDPDLQQIARALEQAVPGTTVQRLSLSPDANNNLVLVTYDKDITITPQFTVGGQTGFSYFDDHVNGRLGGSLAAGPVKVRVHLEYGVDLVNGVPSFYVAANDPTKNPKPLLAVDPITLTGAVSGNLAIKSLANVTASGAASGSLAGQVTLADTADGVNDGRVRASALGASARGTVTGSLNLPDLKFTVKVPVLDSITWSGKLGGSFVGNVFKATDIQFTSKPDAMQLLKQAASGLLSKFAGDNLPLLGDKSFLDLLNKAQDKLGGVSVLSKLGLSLDSVKSLAPKALGAITGATNLAGLRAALGSKFQVLPAYKDTELDKAVTDLINGKQVELIRYTNSLEKEWKDSASVSSPPIPLLPGLTASGSLGVEGNVGGRLFVGVGVDTTGAFIDPKTSFTLYGGARAFAEGSLTLFGLAGASVDVGVGAKLEAGVKLNDPDPTDGKIYLDEVLNPNKGVLDSLLASTKLFAQAEANGFVRAKLELPWPLPDVTLFEKEFAAESLWSFSKDNKVLTPDGKTTFRALALTPDQPLDVDALVRVENGQRVLVLDGSAEANGIDVRLSRTEDGKVKVTWFGKGEGTVANIARVRFVGSPTADRLDVDPTLTVPIIADGGAGNDFLSGGAGNDTLSGGAGADELIGQGGNDVLTGGAGRNILRGGAGNDLLTAGDDGDMLFGDDGADTLIGGAGGDVMDGGAGNDVMDGGAGNDQMLGGLGSDTMSGGDGNDVMDGGDGNDVMDGGAGDDIMDGGAGSDTMSGGLGKDRMGGGAGADRIDGGDGNDIVRGGAGNDTLLGGNGNDLLGGGTGKDVVFGDDEAGLGAQSGQDGIEISFADADGFIDEVHGGPDRDYLVVVGRVDEATGAELADDILIKPGATAGSFVAGWRPAGSTAAFKNVSFTIPDDVDAVWVRGGGGNDRIEIDPAVAAPIYVDGGTGNDTILGGNGPDILYGGAGSDTIDGRGGNDLIFGDGGTDTTAGSVVVVAPADEGNDTISGGAGIDVLLGGGGDDRIDGGAGFDQVRGEAGNDILTNTGDSFGDDMSGGAGNDVLIGGAGGDTLTGGAGDDTLIGGGGPDTMFGDDDSGQATGGPGNDVMVGELGRDTMRGGAGSDVLKAFLDNDLRATVAARTGLSLPAVVPPTPAQDAALTAALEAERTQLLARQAQLLAIPQAQLTPDQKKELQQVQNRLNDVESDLQDLRRFNSNRVDDLRGGDGNDALFGSPFNDRLDGEGGDDTINQSDLGQFGGDVIFGGAGTDAFVILGTAAADTITLRLEADRLVTVLGTGGVLLGKFGEAGTTGAFTEVETLRIMAGDGNDRVSLEGLAQKVPLDGRIEVFGEAGDDTIDAGTYQGKTLLDGGAGNDQLTGGLVSDNLFGGDGNDTLIGGAGNDTLAGGLGDDSLDGGTGDDRLFGDSAPLTLVINGVERSALQLGPIGTIFTPPPGGNDTVIGGAGNDFIDGGSGDDTLLGDSGGILQVGGNDTLIGGAGNDKLVGGFGHDSLDGGDGDDTLFGDNEIVIVADAGGGNDTLIGGAGGDKLFGQGGNDLLIGNAVDGTADGRRDQLDGGSGTDTARVSFKEAETLIGIESVDVARPAGVLFLVRNDQSVAAVDTTTGQVWVAGLLQGNRSRLARMSPDGTELYFVDTINQLWKFTKGGQQTIQQTGVQSFFFDAFGRLRIVPIL